MIVQKPVSWFLTDSGRKFSFGFITSSGIVLTASKFVPQTFFLNKYKEFVQYYRNSQPVELSKEIQDRCQSCLDLLSFTNVHRKLILPFSVTGFDLFHAGSTSSKFGVAVGIPVNFTYKSIEDVAKDKIQVNQREVDLSTETGKKLGEALILPEKVQKFAICREILMTHNNKHIYDSVYPFASLFFAYNLSRFLNYKLNLYSAPLAFRITQYTIVGMLGLGIYFLMKDVTQIYYETKIDTKLCGLGLDYIQSGIEFYGKLLQRNQALRELMGKEGEKKYSITGNENFFIRQPRIALYHRKQFFEEQLKNAQDEQLKHDFEEKVFS